MNERVKGVLKDLETATQSLQAFADDLWLGINHRDREAREKGTRTFDAYMDHVAAIEALAAQVAGLLEPLDSAALNGDGAHESQDTPVSQMAAHQSPITLYDDFRKRKHWGYQLLGRTIMPVRRANEWYVRLCQDLATINPVRFADLPENPKFITRVGSRRFSRDRTELATPRLIADDVYAEVKLGANAMRDIMRDLLTEWGIPHTDLKTYVMEGR